MINSRLPSAVVLLAFAAACGSGVLPTNTIGPSVPPSVVPSPTVMPSSLPSQTATTLGSGEQALDAGTYRLELDKIPSGGAGFPAALITLPVGWYNYNGWAVHRTLDGTVAVQFWDVGKVYGHPCDWNGTLFEPGPTVDDLANALVDIPLRNATQPTVVTLDGYTGKYLEWSVPSDMGFSSSGIPDAQAGCDADSDGAAFQSWIGVVRGNRYQQGPGQVDRLWILDVNGSRVVIDAFDMPSATDAERQELLDVVQSIRFEE